MTTKGKLILGLIGLIILWLLLLIFRWDLVEKDIAGRVSDVLSDEGYSWATVDTENQGRDVSVSGLTRTESEISEVKTTAEGIYGVRKVDTSNIKYAPLKAAGFQVKQNDTGVVLTGTVDSEASATALLGMVKSATNTPVTNQLTFNSDTATPAWFADLGNLVPNIAGVEQPEFSIKDNQFSLSGITRTQQQLDDLARTATNLETELSIDSTGLILDPSKPASFSISSIDGAIEASGLVADQASVDALMKGAADFGATTLNIQMGDNVLASPWLGHVEQLMPVVKLLDQGAVSASENGIEVSGIARSQEINDVMTNLLASMNEVDLKSTVTFRPWKTPALSVGEIDGKIVATGQLPDQDTIDQIDGLAQTLASDLALNYENTLSLEADVQTTDWLASASSIIPALNTLKQPSLKIDQTGLRITGTATSERDQNRISALAIDAANGIPLSNSIGLEKAVIVYNVPDTALDQCESDLDNKMIGETIEFATGSATLSPSSYRLLNIMVSAIYDCPKVIIEVSGHTDNVGSASTNQGLSLQRAQSVVEYLVAAGVLNNKLAAVGKGSVEPIADNETAEGRAANRRIEFNIKY